MLGFLGFNLFADKYSVDTQSIDVSNYSKISISNGIYDQLTFQNNLGAITQQIKDKNWFEISDTAFNALFSDSLAAGSFSESFEDIDYVKIKRKRKNSYIETSKQDLRWKTIRKVDIEKPEDLRVSFKDHITQTNIDYEYKYITVRDGVESPSQMTAEVHSCFNGVFICNKDTCFAIDGNISYSDTVANVKNAVVQPLGSAYPYVIQNGVPNYLSGGVSGLILGESIYQTGKMDRYDMFNQRQKLIEFLTDAKPKVLKDYNGTYVLVSISGQPKVSYPNDSGLTMATVSFEWTEIGNIHDTETMVIKNLLEGD